MSGNNTNADILLAGAFAAFTVDLLVYPLDTLKTRLQSASYACLYLHAGTRTINRAVLFRGLYQGVGAFFTTYEGIKALLTSRNSPSASGPLPQPVVHSIASSVGELVSCAILTPAEVVKQNAQMVDGRVGGGDAGGGATVRALSKFRTNPLGLWRGYAALAGRNLPFTALQFPAFERAKEYLKDRRDRAGTRTGSLVESGVITAVSAGSAGGVAAAITTPIDVIKTRIMLSAADEAVESRISRRGGSGKSSLVVAGDIVAHEGLRGLWRGGALRTVWTMVGSGLYLGVYESGRIWLARRSGQHVSAEDLF